MTDPFELTDDERCFLAHWMYEAMGPFWGPSIIWCLNHRISDWGRAPYTLAMVFSREEIAAGRLGWSFERPPVPFRVPWSGHDEFWERTAAAATDARIRGIGLYPPASLLVNVRGVDVEGTPTPAESDYLRAYYREMAGAGTGHHVDLAEQHGVLDLHLMPFFAALDDLHAEASPIARFPWTDFPGRYEELTGRKYTFPDHALRQR